MRNRWYDKVLLFIVALFLFIGAILCVSMPLVAVRAYVTFIMNSMTNLSLLLFVGVGVILLVLFAYVLASLFTKKAPRLPSHVNVKVSDVGSVDIAVSALDMLVQKSARAYPAVKDCRSLIMPMADGGISVQLRISLMPDAVVPELTAQMQAEVKEFVESHSGISIREIRILVESASTAVTAARVQ